MVFWKTVETVLVFIGLGVVGFMLLSRKAIPQQALTTLSFLSLDLAVPALVFYDMMMYFQPEKFSFWWLYPLIWLGSFGFLAILSWIGSFLFSREYRRDVFVSLLYPNALFIPLILLPAIFPQRPEVTVELFLFTMLFSFFLFEVFGFFYGKKKWNFQWNKMFPPLVVILVGSLVLYYVGWRPLVPGFLIDLARRIGVLSIPLLMFVLGGNIYLDRKAVLLVPIPSLISFVLLKNMVFPLIHFWLVGILPVPSSLKFFVFLQSALPPVTALPVLVEREGGNRQAVQAFFLWSLLALVLTLPFWLWLYEKVYG